MATKRKTAPRISRSTLVSGPWKGVFDSIDPFDADQDSLVDLKNCYIPDAAHGSGVYARPGFVLQNSAAPLVSAVTTGAAVSGQGLYVHEQLDGTLINFAVCQGRLFRVSYDFSTAVDVTPAGITIDSNPIGAVFFASQVGNLIVNDETNRMWVGTNLTSTPITGQYIDYDGLGGAWSAFGQPVVKDGCVIVILNTVNGVSRRGDISWSEPGLPLVGWQQPSFDDNWTLATNDADALYALCATNLALYYFRESSIGTASGTVGPNFQSTATQDSVSFNVGSRTCRSIQKFGNTIFFCDAAGRPHLLQPGAAPAPIWKQLRSTVDAARTDAVGITDTVLTSAIEKTLNLYLLAAWSPNPSAGARPFIIYAFDAATGAYHGRWTIYDYGPNDLGLSQGIPIESMGTLVDVNGLLRLAVFGGLDGAIVSDQGGYLWVLATAAEARQQPGMWNDNLIFPDRAVTTDRLGNAEDVVVNIDRATLITGSPSPCSVTVSTANASNVLEGTPTPNVGGADSTYRLVVGCELHGRGPSVAVRPTTGNEQWSLHRISLVAIASTATPEDS